MATTLPKPDVTPSDHCQQSETGSYRVELDIRPNSGQQSARFIDQLPAGFTAEAIESKAQVQPGCGKVIFRWTALPQDSLFTISYRATGPVAAGAPEISGMLVLEPKPST